MIKGVGIYLGMGVYLNEYGIWPQQLESNQTGLFPQAKVVDISFTFSSSNDNVGNYEIHYNPF